MQAHWVLALTHKDKWMALTKIIGEGIDGGTISTKTAGTGNLILGSTAGDSITSGGDNNTNNNSNVDFNPVGGYSDTSRFDNF